MLDIRFIRHAESAANAGTKTSDPAAIPLTEKGHAQSFAIRDSFVVAPDLFICSPFVRVLQTASPTFERFSDVPVETWPIHEFTYLSPLQCVNTTVEQRRPWVTKYWDAADAQLENGPGAESFCSFIDRVQLSLSRLAGLRVNSVAVFGHGQCMQAIRCVVLTSPKQISCEEMRQFRAYDLENPISNGGDYSLRYERERFTLNRQYPESTSQVNS